MMKQGWSVLDVCTAAGAGREPRRLRGGGKQSSVESKLVDGKGQPVAGVKIVAVQVQPIKGYEQFETVTKADGAFRLEGLFPSSAYLLKPWSDKWNCETEVSVASALQGETAVLPEPMTIRFTVSSDGVITDGTTGLEWVVGPDEDTDYVKAQQWVAACAVNGGKWRMPTQAELKGLYQKGVGKYNLAPSFKITDSWVWVESENSSRASAFDYRHYYEASPPGGASEGLRAFGVRLRPR